MFVRIKEEYLRFDYLRPETVNEACSLLSRYQEAGKLIAGGTDLMVLKKGGHVSPRYIIDLKAIPNLDYIHYVDGEGLKMGTLATIHDIESSLLIQERLSVIASAAHQIGTPQIRNMATIGGNLCRAAPSADMAPPLIGLGANVKIIGSHGERSIGIEEFFLGPGETVLRSDEILTEIQVPNPLPHTGGVYLKWMPKTRIAIAVVCVAVVITLDSKHGSIADAKIVLGAVAPTPIRATTAEDIIKGMAIGDKLIEEAARVATQEAKPISDIRGSADYRREMVKVFVNRAIRQAIACAN